MRRMTSLDELQRRASGGLPAHLGMRITHLAEGELRAELTLGAEHMAANGYLHAGTVVSLADTAAGFGCIAHLPNGAESFTTIELKTNHVATARAGTVACVARLVHGGRTTQVWDATVRHVESGRILAHYRATQLLLCPRAQS